MTDENQDADFEAITLSNVWIKQHILDLIEKICQNEVIATCGGHDLITISSMEHIELLRLRLEGLKLMHVYVAQLRDNVGQYIGKIQSLKVDLLLSGIKDAELVLNNVDCMTHEDNFYLSPAFDNQLKTLRMAKSILINEIGDAELLMPKKDADVKGKKVELEESEDVEGEKVVGE